MNLLSCEQNGSYRSSHIHDRMQDVLYRVAAFIGCHQRLDRSTVLLGKQIPICDRCLGMLVGILLCGFVPFPFWLASASIFLFLADGISQWTGLRSSNKLFRLVTGLLFFPSILTFVLKVV